MKNTLPLIMIVLFATFSNAQHNSYEALWKKVDQFQNEGLPKSALKVVDDISKLAAKNQNTPQIIKSMLHKGKYALILEEDAQLKIINEFKEEIEKSKFPAKNVLESILANMYWQYFNGSRWKFYNRTKTSEKVDVTDFRTWDLQTLFDEIHLHYQNSLHNGLMLQLEPLSAYEDILAESKDSKIYRPTLFDFLSHNALEFYQTDETHITSPSYKFEIDNPKFMDDFKTFSTLKIASKDSASLQLNALKVYQNLIKFHAKDETSMALADINIRRLKFINQHATFSDKQALLLHTLIAEKESLKANPTSTLYDYEIASQYHIQGQNYQPKINETNRWKVKEARAICEEVISKYPNSVGAKKCLVLKEQIELPSLQIITEKVIPIQQNARVLIKYKNLNKLEFKILKVSQNQLKKFNKKYQQEEKLAFIKKLKSHKDWKSALRNESDFQLHTTEITVPKLDNGHYIMYAALENDTSIFSFSTIQVTNLAFIENTTSEFASYQIIDRNHGTPIKNASVKLSYFKSGSRILTTTEHTTDAFGEIKINRTPNTYYRNVSAEIKYLDDVAHFGSYYIGYSSNRNSKEAEIKSFIFTDRSIYRPGQTVYFKAITLKAEKGKSEVLPNLNVYATLRNANNEELQKLTFKTNEFGSVSGEFVLPNGGLNGNYVIEVVASFKHKDAYSHHAFSVEEYKRPKFETSFQPITQTYKVNDSVSLKGHALAYAGSQITDAKVVYRVHRKVQYPRWCYWYYPSIFNKPQEITHGETITNSKGEFEITFKAIPDSAVDKANLPVFNYEVTVDVTDLNGETRSATTIVHVGYHALTANIFVSNLIDKTKKTNTIKIDTRNLNGTFIPAEGTVKIHKLTAPKKVMRPRPWGAPDYNEFSKEAFQNTFPHEAYGNEHDITKWERSAPVFTAAFNTEKTSELKLGKIKKWESGSYIIVLESKDKFGQWVKDEVITALYSHSDKTLADQQLFSISTDKTSYKPGDNAVITLGSAAEQLNVTIHIEKNSKIIKTQILKLNNNKKTVTIPVTAEDIGGFQINYSFAAFNSFQSNSLAISVPYPNSQLEIETSTFRDKLQPGTDETWSFKIKGPQGDKVSAELLAGMYDASLDQFRSHSWAFSPINKPRYYSHYNNNGHRSFGTHYFNVYNNKLVTSSFSQHYDQLDWFGFNMNYSSIRILGHANRSLSKNAPLDLSEEQETSAAPMLESSAELDDVIATNGYSASENKKEQEANIEKPENDSIGSDNTSKFDAVKIRKNLQETAFFFPHLKTDANGHVSFSFTTPEALTQWNLQLLAHTKTLESAVKRLSTVTQKELMVIPNAPRFLRAGDAITISTKIANLTKKSLSGEATLVLTDAISGKDVSKILLDVEHGRNNTPNAHTSTTLGTQTFTVDSKGNTQVSWRLNIPDHVQAVQYQVIAKAETFSDGEQNALPVLSNRILVTETLPMWIRSDQTKTFRLDKLASSGTSTTLKNHKLTLELTSNPAWYAVQALPYLMEYPHECNEQIFSRYYANTLASHIVNSNPKIQDVFNQWKSGDALISNLEKNQELKSILIQETPWLRDAQSETEQKKRIALLFDLNKMNNDLQFALRKLQSNQMDSGGWSWFKGGYESRYISQHIITGFGHLSKLGVIPTGKEPGSEKSHNKMISRAIDYLDAQFVKEYKDIRKYNSKISLKKDHLTYNQLHYLYMRSFFPDIKKSKEVKDIIQYYHTQIQTYWTRRPLYAKGLMALVSHRRGDSKIANKILKSLKETSVTSEELGMYWKENISSWFWYQAPIETQALLIEVFSEAGTTIQSATKNLETIDNLKIWLLKNKQTNRWGTTKSTTDAVYALLLQGSDWLSVTDMVDVVVGGQGIEPSKLEGVKVEAGTGYYKTSWNASEIKPEMAEVKLTKKGDGIAWGSLYWQYFEDLDKITMAETPLKLKKKLFLKQNTDKGEVISEITKDTHVKVGDLVRVRIELRSDRAMEFVHMKDMRASGLEPINVLSQYKWQDGLGYYESTKDASTNFFFDYLPKGIYVFEYDLRVNNAGDMSHGITTIQSMYAPEFSSHSKGTRLLVK